MAVVIANWKGFLAHFANWLLRCAPRTMTAEAGLLESYAADIDPPVGLARRFLRLVNLPNFALDRLSRHEATLWRQVGQALFPLDAFQPSAAHRSGRTC